MGHLNIYYDAVIACIRYAESILLFGLGTSFDFYVGENSAEVVAVRGKVSSVHAATSARYDVSAGSPSVLADQSQVSSGEGTVDPDWDRLNVAREAVTVNEKPHNTVINRIQHNERIIRGARKEDAVVLRGKSTEIGNKASVEGDQKQRKGCIASPARSGRRP